MAKYEYKTTHGAQLRVHVHDRFICSESCSDPDVEPDDPVEPEGPGWELVNTAASTARLYWTWRRKKP